MIEKAGDKYWCVFVEEILWAPNEKLKSGTKFTLRCVPKPSGRLFSLLFC